MNLQTTCTSCARCTDRCLQHNHVMRQCRLVGQPLVDLRPELQRTNEQTYTHTPLHAYLEELRFPLCTRCLPQPLDVLVRKAQQQFASCALRSKRMPNEFHIRCELNSGMPRHSDDLRSPCSRGRGYHPDQTCDVTLWGKCIASGMCHCYKTTADKQQYGINLGHA